MTEQIANQNQITPIVQDELILVVKRTHLFPDKQGWHGIKTDGIETLVETIKTHHEFMPRSIAETDDRYKQIIPYAVFRHQDRYFLMLRKGNATEQRLKSKYTLGIGGHMRSEDMSGSSIFDWAIREFHEEVTFDGTLTHTLLGIINDDSNEVGRVHMGLVLLFDGDSSNISIRSELQDGFLVKLDECELYMLQMESWASMVFNHLQQSRV